MNKQNVNYKKKSYFLFIKKTNLFLQGSFIQIHNFKRVSFRLNDIRRGGRGTNNPITYIYEYVHIMNFIIELCVFILCIHDIRLYFYYFFYNTVKMFCI